jgi:Holliday junction resolvase RusA-like endonuclease
MSRMPLPDLVWDAPFACPPDVVLDLPVPPSVNRTKRIDWKYQKKLKVWKQSADGFVHIAKRNGLKLEKIPRFELRIVFSEEHTNSDLDNIIKHLIDYLRYIELLADDAKKHMRKIVVEWGEAPEGARITVVRLS